MRRRIFTLVVVLLIFGSDHAQSEGQSEDRRITIDFNAIDLEGQPFNGLSLKGKIVLLDFWAIWCRPCIAAFPSLKKLNADFEDSGFAVVGIAAFSGTVDDVRKFAVVHKLDYTVLVGDQDLVQRFGVIGYPTYFLVRRDGTTFKKYVGEMENLYKEVEADILEIGREMKLKGQ